MRYLLICLLLAPLSVFAEYVPSGSHRWYNADVDSTKVTTGQAENYFSDGKWRVVKSDFYLNNGWLVSDSGIHEVRVNVSTNKLWLKWGTDTLGIEIGNLYAYHRMTNQRFQLAEANFNTRSFADDTIFFYNIYPDVDLKIINGKGSLKHEFHFSQTARNSLESWWQNNGQLDDIYIVNTFKLDISKFSYDWVDGNNVIDLSSEHEINNSIAFLDGLDTLFGVDDSPVELWASPTQQAQMYKRIMLINSNIYLAEGFKWSDVRGWGSGEIVHNATFGDMTTTGSHEATGANTKRGYLLTMNAEEATLDSAYFRGRAQYNGDDTVIVFLYDDVTRTSANLVTESDTIFVTDDASASWGSVISGTLSASTDYWLCIINIGSTSLGLITNTSSNLSWTQADTYPIDDPDNLTTAITDNHSIWFVYTVGGVDVAPIRRRRILQ